MSLAKDNFQRVRLIEAHNSVFNYDLISICETSLNDSVELPETLVIIRRTLDVVSWVFSLKILSPLFSEMTCLSMNR